ISPPAPMWRDFTNLYCLDVANASFASNTDVNAFACKNPIFTNFATDIRNQQWIIDTIPGATYPLDGLGNLARGSYILRSVGDPTLCLDVRGATTGGGERLQLYPCGHVQNPTTRAALNQSFGAPGVFAFESGGAPLARPLTPATLTGLDVSLAPAAWTLGYQFTPTKNIVVTDLGGRFPHGAPSTSNAFTVRLYDGTSRAMLASASVTSNDAWAYAPIAPVVLLANHVYTVAVYLNYQYNYVDFFAMPISNADITINQSCHNTTTAEPCGLAGA